MPRAQHDGQTRRIKFSPSKSSPTTLIREYRKVRSRKNWLQRELYNSGYSEPEEKTPSEAKPTGGRKRKIDEVSEAGVEVRQQRRVKKMLKRFDALAEQHLHTCDYNDFVHALLLRMSVRQRAELRAKTVMQQEAFLQVRRSFKELETTRLNPDFAIDLEYNCLISDRIRRFIRRRGTMRHHNNRWKATTHLEVPEPRAHSRSMGITKPVRWPSLLPPEGKTLSHKKWLRDGFGMLLTKQGVGAHLHPLKLAAHVLAEARLSGRLKPLEGCRTRHTVQLLNDAMRLTKSGGYTRYIVRAVSVVHEGANSIENGRNVASFRQGDKHEFLTTHFEVPNAIINSFAKTTVIAPQPRGKGREEAKVETSIELRLNRATLEDLQGDADAKRHAERTDGSVESRAEETERCGVGSSTASRPISYRSSEVAMLLMQWRWVGM